MQEVYEFLKQAGTYYLATVDPKIEICAFTGGKWIRVAATAVNDDRIEAKESMLEAYPSLKGMYKADDDNTQVLWLKDATATISSFTEPAKVIKF